jgi:transcription initiation factor TFIID subunit 13
MIVADWFLVKSLMYAFGDVPNPYPETVNVLEDILQEYIINIVGTTFFPSWTQLYIC